MSQVAMRTVVIVGADRDFAAKLQPLLPNEEYDVQMVDGVGDVPAFAADKSISVVVLGPSVDETQMLAAADDLLALCPEPSLVAVAPAVDTDLLRKAMRAGLHDMLSAAEQTWSEVVAAVVDAASDAAERWEEGAAAPTEPTSRGTVVAVMGTKGGVGKSVIATNLAASMAEQGSDVVLVDLDLHSGDTGIMMSLEPVHTIRDAAAASERLDSSMLAGYLTQHRSGARVLLAPIRPEDSDIVTAARVARVLSLMTDIADVVVVDTPSVWDETTLAAVDASSRILAVTGMDVPSIKNTAVMLGRLEQLGRLNGQVHVVLNRADSKVLVEEKDVEKALGRGVSTRIPSDRAVPRSVNMGVPIVIEAPRSAVAKALVGLSRTLSANEV